MNLTKLIYIGLSLCGIWALVAAGFFAHSAFVYGDYVFLAAWVMYVSPLLILLGRFRMKLVREELDQAETERSERTS